MVFKNLPFLQFLDVIYVVKITPDNRMIVSASFEEIKVWGMNEKNLYHTYHSAHDGKILYLPYNQQTYLPYCLRQMADI
jgi:hypothetical protein